MSQIGQLVNPTGLNIQTLTGDSGGAVPPDGAGNINTFGGNNLTVTGNPGTSTLTFDVDGTVADTYAADSGTATPAGGVLTVTGAPLFETTGSGSTLTIGPISNFEATGMHSWNGSVVEQNAVTVTSDGATITFSVEQDGGGDLTAVFSDGFYDWDTTPADTVVLTAGSDTSPQINYVYLLQSTKTLTASTGGFPAAEHVPLATVICQTAASLQTEGPYKLHAWTDHLVSSTDQGHIPDINSWIRQQRATWKSGVSQTYTITTNIGTPDDVLITNSSGVVLQLHPHTFPAFGGTPDYYVINDLATPYTIVNDLNALLTDSTGASMSGRYFSLVLWGVVSEDTGDSKVFINLPSGSYNNQSSLESDMDAFANYTIPGDYTGTGFLISEWKLRHQVSSGGTWTSIDEIDLRGLFPSVSVTGSNAFPNEFGDNVFRIFDDGDDTKKIAFEASSITTSTTRTITMVDADLDLAEVATTFTCDTASATPAANILDILGGTLINTAGATNVVTINADDAVAASFPTDSGTATPSGNALTIVGANGVTTSGSSATVTITGSGSSIYTWVEETGTTADFIAGQGIIANNGAGITITLPATAALGTVIRVAGVGAGGWSIDQGTGQSINYLGTSTTVTSGTLAGDEVNACLELLCIVADTTWLALSSTGNFTIT